MGITFVGVCYISPLLIWASSVISTQKVSVNLRYINIRWGYQPHLNKLTFVAWLMFYVKFNLALRPKRRNEGCG